MRHTTRSAGADADAQQQVEVLHARIRSQFDSQNWGEVEQDTLRLMKLLRLTSPLLPVTQSFMAEVLARFGLALNRQQRSRESYEALSQAEALLNMAPDGATEWAAEQDIVLQGEGEPIDLKLALEALQLFADMALRQGQSRAGDLLDQVVQVADLIGAEDEQWEARSRMATYTAGLADWQGLLEMAREMGQIAGTRRDLRRLLQVMSLFSDAYTGLERVQRAIEAQQLVVDIAHYLNHPELVNEEKELKRLREVPQ